MILLNYALCLWFSRAITSRSAWSQSSFSWPGVHPRSWYSSKARWRTWTSRSMVWEFGEAETFRGCGVEVASGMVRTCLLDGVAARGVFAFGMCGLLYRYD